MRRREARLPVWEALHQLMSGQWTGALGTYMYQADARTAYERISLSDYSACIANSARNPGADHSVTRDNRES